MIIPRLFLRIVSKDYGHYDDDIDTMTVIRIISIICQFNEYRPDFYRDYLHRIPAPYLLHIYSAQRWILTQLNPIIAPR